MNMFTEAQIYKYILLTNHTKGEGVREGLMDSRLQTSQADVHMF